MNFAILVEVFMNHILPENTYFTNHIVGTKHRLWSYNLQISTKLFSIVTILKTFLLKISDFQHHSISLASKSFSNIIFANCKTIINSKYLFTIWFNRVSEKYFTKLCNKCFLRKFQGTSIHVLSIIFCGSYQTYSIWNTKYWI